MTKKVLALNTKGELTYCTAPEDKRGQGRCNHVAHQEEGQSQIEFMSMVDNMIRNDVIDELPDQKPYIEKLIKQYGRVDTPEFEEIIRDVDNCFTIGKKGEEDYHEAILTKLDSDLCFDEDGDYRHLVAHYELDGREYTLDLGNFPEVNPDGTIVMDGSRWRVLPVVEQRKAGVISYADNIVLMQKNGNVGIFMPREGDSVGILGRYYDLDTVSEYMRTKDESLLPPNAQLAIDNLDPIVFERFPELGKSSSLSDLKELPQDEVGDLTWRRTIGYGEIFKEEYEKQARRMGVTFRRNIAKQQEFIANGGTQEEADEKFPLFYQQNLQGNVKGELISRSNVQNADDLNPIAALSQSQKISYTGPGGFNKDKAPNNLRMPHMSHQGLIDTMDVSAGKNIGLTGTLYGGYIGKDRLIHPNSEIGKKSLAPADFVPYANYSDPNRTIMAVAHLKQAVPIIGGEDPLVKTPAWDNIAGAKLGCNLRTVYVPGDGVYDDSVVISESAAKKMGTYKSQTYRVKPNNAGDMKNYKVGDKVERKQSIAGDEIRFPGEIESIKYGDDGSVIYSVKSYYEMGVGDKMAGRSGNKSVVSKVLPDDQMPKMKMPDGSYKHSEVIMSPNSVIGRKNLSQIMEVNENMGDGPVINAKRRVIIDDEHAVDATGGIQYIVRLNHIASKKLASHADEIQSNKEVGSGRLGEMESLLLTQNEERAKVLKYLRHQEQYDSHEKLRHLLKASGIDMQGVNFDYDKRLE